MHTILKIANKGAIMSSSYYKLYSVLNRYRKYIPILIDTCIAILSYLMPFTISGIHHLKIEIFSNTFLIYTLIYIGTFVVMKVYKNMWRYSGIKELYLCLNASIMANVLFLIITKLIGINIFYYVYPTATVVSSFCTMSARIIYRAILIAGNKDSNNNVKHTNVMIVGAGQATSAILNEIKLNNHNNFLVKCIIDDDKTKIGRDINSVPVVGNTTKICEMVDAYNIEEIIISIPSLDKGNKKRILDICSGTKCKLKILPEIYSLIAGGNYKELMGKVRDVEVEDLLGREPIILDCELTKEYIKDKIVLVTGGGGSIGSELCRQISTYSPKKLIILDIYENNAYNIQQELIRLYESKLNMEVEIASVRDKNKLEKIFSTRNIDIVFHAAAHKHVPLMEKNPEEAIKNNVIGTYNVAVMADKYKIDKFVLISTDKAVNPTNIMGATKRVCEMLIQAFNAHSDTDYVAVRFGNVLGSNGSVIPLFINQIKEGGPVTITHEEITRYFMTIPEAVQLVMRAAAIASGGEIFVLDMGEPVKIKDLAYNLIRLSGLVPNEDIKIKYTGLRPGEKLYEELLISKNSRQVKTNLEKIFIERPTEFNVDELFDNIGKLQEAAHNVDTEMVISLIENIVPTYKRTPNAVNIIENIEHIEHIEQKEQSIHKNKDSEKMYNVLNVESA